MIRLTMAQALVRFLSAQSSERDGRRQPFFAGVFGIFGHGNVAGIGQALDQMSDRLRYYQCRNEQAMVHTAAAFAKMSNRLRTLACTTSIGPGATNMITGAAGATINRLPVLLLPGDIFANRAPAPVLQQLESGQTPGHLGQRLLSAGLALLGPHQPPRAAADVAAGSDARAHIAGRDRRRDAGAAARYADRSVRLSGGVLRRARLDGRAAERRCRRVRARGGRDSVEPEPAHHRRRRRALQRGHRGAAPLRRSDRHRGRRRRRRARARFPGITRWRRARSASRGRSRPTGSRAKPTS